MVLLLGHHNPRAVATISICAVFGLLAFTAIVFRLWARRLKKAVLCFNDYAILVALVNISFSLPWRMPILTNREVFAAGLAIVIILGMLNRIRDSSSFTQHHSGSKRWIRPTCAVVDAGGVGN
jgi:hypothetical protein